MQFQGFRCTFTFFSWAEKKEVICKEKSHLITALILPKGEVVNAMFWPFIFQITVTANYPIRGGFVAIICPTHLSIPTTGSGYI